jgi:hypothetical protein
MWFFAAAKFLLAVGSAPQFSCQCFREQVFVPVKKVIGLENVWHGSKRSGIFSSRSI